MNGSTMAAAASSEVPPYIPILVATLPVILSPILAWAVGRSRVSKEAATIDYLNKRLDILERLNKLDTQLTQGPIRPFLDTEIEHCRAFLHQPPTFIPHTAEAAVAAPQSRWARFFLTQPALSVRKRIFKGLFYFFFIIAMLYLPLTPILLFSEAGEEYPVLLVSFLVGFVFYFGVALLFRRAAR
jgi:hypothetical protein